MEAPSFVIRTATSDQLAELGLIDEEAGTIFSQVGITFDLTPDSPFILDERRRWRLALERGDGRVAVGAEGDLLGFAILEHMDGEPYLEQLSVRPLAMRRGIGRALLEEAYAHAGPRALLLTTYAHVPWNAPFYLRFGFEPVPPAAWGPELAREVDAQRAALPAPDQRVVMRRPPPRRG